MKTNDKMLEKIKRSRRASRQLHGRPGQGRKTRFVDQRKRAAAQACRGRTHTDE